MRPFSKAKGRGWKDTLLKMKIRKKMPAFTIIAAGLACITWIFIAQAFFMLMSGTFNVAAAHRTALQSEQNAQLDIQHLKNLDFYDLDSYGAHPRRAIEGIDPGWESEVTIGPEKHLDGVGEDVKMRLAHVAVFRQGDVVSRYDVDVPLTTISVIPKGTIMSWSGSLSRIPAGWKLCDGRNGTPDLRDRFIVGAGRKYGYGDTGGEDKHRLTISEMPAHSHGGEGDFARGGWDTSNGQEYSGDYPIVISLGDNYPWQGYYRNFRTTTEGGGNAHENRPPYFAVYFIMKVV